MTAAETTPARRAPNPLDVLARSHDPLAVQAEVWPVWEADKSFTASADDPGEPYAIVIPPPNVTAALHLGHALNNTVQDILIRWRRMSGDNAVWIPGTDHAGIATQTVVEKRVLASEGKRRTDFDRETFVEKIRAWKDEYEQTILGQLRAMGCSCDWNRTAFTMDDKRAAAVREAFSRLFNDGLIYRGKRLVNWDPLTQTALADDEVEMEEIDGHFYYLKYPLADGSGHVTVATTRPETMLGDTAVAMNPKDPRAGSLRGRSVKLPIVDRIIPIVEDDYVVMADAAGDDPKAKYATGFLKVTPAHDPNDWEIGRRHGLDVINVMAPDASISDAHGWTPETEAARRFAGMSREEGRRAVVAWFREHGLLEEVRPYRHSVGHSYRSHVPVEPYLSDQWYVAVKKPIPWMADTGNVEETDVPRNSLAGLALTALEEAPRTRHDREGVRPAQPAQPTPQSIPQPAPTSVDPRPYFITFTTKGTRLHGHADGSVDRDHNLPGTPYLPADETLETLEADQSDHPPVTLDADARRAVLDQLIETCARRGWYLHAAHVRTTHVHVVLAAADAPERVMNDLKGYATRRLRTLGLAPAERVWTRHGSTRWLLPKSIPAAVSYVVDEQGEALDPAPFFARSGQTPAAPAALPHGRASRGDDLGDDGDDSLRFVPDRYAKTFQLWHENIRDWCISRQLWWGHRIPVWTDSQGRHHLRPVPQATQDPDVLDTWFSSALWPLSTLGWPDRTPDLATWNPTATLCTAREIITLWVSRMVMFNRYLLAHPDEATTSRGASGPFPAGPVPFRDVFIHAMIQDGEGRKMSKSLGNGVDPLDIIASHGADAMRYTLASMVTHTQDVRLPVERDPVTGRNTSPKFDLGRNFCNKLWNATRFALTNLADTPPPAGPLAVTALPERWLIARLNATIVEATDALDQYRFDQYARVCYDFVWRDFCDWYLELAKPALRRDDTRAAEVRQTLTVALDAFLRLLHPVIPFMTERLWWAFGDVLPDRPAVQRFGGQSPAEPRLVRANFPLADPRAADDAAVADFVRLQDLVTAIRTLRNDHKADPRKRFDATIRCPSEDVTLLIENRGWLETLALITTTSIGPDARPSDAARVTVDVWEVTIAGLIDSEAERQRVGKRQEDLSRQIAAMRGRLVNPGYVAKAPPHLVEQTKAQLAAAEAELATLG